MIHIQHIGRLLLMPKEMTFDFVVPEMPVTEGVQKVRGFSRGYHHHNSIRLGIRKQHIVMGKGEVYYLYLYAYISGKRHIMKLHYYPIFKGEKISVRMGYTRTSVYCEADWKDAPVTRSAYVRRDNWLFPIGYTLGSYFEYDGQDYPSLNIDYNVTNLKIK